MSTVRNQRLAGHWVPFAYGFRPFFLLAGWFAVLAVGAWLAMYGFALSPPQLFPGHFWHGHEMVFGFATAAVAGFLLTAVPSWTGSRGIGGFPLLLLSMIWLAGRVVVASADGLPWLAVAAVELTFLPVLALFVAPPLVRARNRNWPLLVLLAGMWLADAFLLAAARAGNLAQAATMLLVALDILLLLVTIVGGRIVPVFTANALKRVGHQVQARRWAGLERVIVLLMIAIVIVDAFGPPGRHLAGGLAALAGLAHGIRLAGWHGLRTLREPIVWVLHVAYFWLPLGLLLKATYLLSGFDWAALWLHALGMGGAATMVLAVMSRAALGHTGRQLRVGQTMAWAYALLLLAVVIRVFGPALAPGLYRQTVLLAGAFWISAWCIYVWKYSPILVQPRVDGKPG